MSRCLIFGECMIELSHQTQGVLKQAFAGDTFNTAVYLKRCLPQKQVSYLTAIGQDYVSDELITLMQSESIDSSLVIRSQDKTLGLYMVRTDETGERSFMYWRNDSAAKQTLDLLSEPPKDVSDFYFSGISLAILPEHSRQKLIDLAEYYRKQGARIVFDPNYRARLWESADVARKWIDLSYDCADLAFPGGDDHFDLYQHTNSDDIFAYLDNKNIAEIVLKNGPQNVLIQTSDGRVSVPITAIKNIVDTTSAGDSFIGGYLAARLAGKDPENATRYAAKVAGVVIGFKGAIVEEKAFSELIEVV